MTDEQEILKLALELAEWKDRAEKAEAELHELTEPISDAGHTVADALRHEISQWKARAEKAEARIAELEATLKKIRAIINLSSAGQTAETKAIDAALKEQGRPKQPNWRDDPSADERWNAGLDYGQTQLCKVLGVDPASVSWDAATETLDGDVRAVIGNILNARFGDDWRKPTSEHDVEHRIAALEAELTRLATFNKELTDKCNFYNVDGARLERERDEAKATIERLAAERVELDRAALKPDTGE